MTVFTDGSTIANFGFKIEVQFIDDQNNPIDISAATGKKIVFIKPSGDTVPKDASFTTDGLDGRIYYTVESNLFLEEGRWEFYGIADKTSTFNKSTSSDRIEVYKVAGLA